MPKKKKGDVLNDGAINANEKQNIGAELNMPAGRKKPQKSK